MFIAWIRSEDRRLWMRPLESEMGCLPMMRAIPESRPGTVPRGTLNDAG